MGFSQSFNTLGSQFTYLSGKQFGYADKRPARSGVYSRETKWPNGIDIETLMSWMNDCAKYHRWEDEFGNGYSVTPDGFKFFINGNELSPNIGAENIEDYKEEGVYSDLRGYSWTHLDFWEQLFAQLAYMYEQVDQDSISDNRNKFEFLKRSDRTNLYISGLVERHNNSYVDDQITFEQVEEKLVYGSPHSYRNTETGTEYLFPSGLLKYSKVPRFFYNSLLSHGVGSRIYWGVNTYSQSINVQYSVEGYLYEVAKVERLNRGLGPCITPSYYEGNCNLSSVDYFDPNPIYIEKSDNKRTFFNDKDKFIEELLKRDLPFNEPGLISTIYWEQPELINYWNGSMNPNLQLGIRRSKTVAFDFNIIAPNDFMPGIELGQYGEGSSPGVIQTVIREDENGNTIGAIGLIKQYYPYYQWNEKIYDSSGNFISYGPHYIEGNILYSRPEIDSISSLLTPTLPEYLEKYGVKNVNFFPYVRDGKLCPKIYSKFVAQALMFNDVSCFSTHVGSGNVYTKYGLPTANRSAEAILELIYNNRDKEQSGEIEIRYGIHNYEIDENGFATSPDIFSGEILTTISQSGEIHLDFEKIFTLKGNTARSRVWFGFKHKDAVSFDEELKLFKKYLQDSLTLFTEELGYDPFNPDSDWAGIFGYDPEKESFPTIDFIKPTRSQVFEFDVKDYVINQGYPDQYTWSSPGQIYAKAWFPGDQNPYYYYFPNSTTPTIVDNSKGPYFEIDKFYTLGSLQTNKPPFLLRSYNTDSKVALFSVQEKTIEDIQNATNMYIGSDEYTIIRVPLSRPYPFQN